VDAARINVNKNAIRSTPIPMNSGIRLGRRAPPADSAKRVCRVGELIGEVLASYFDAGASRGPAESGAR